MIKVENLRKIYNPEKKSSSVGLYHVTFTLPSKGMVFVVGKSGSGKSTLLNILGGLDSSSGGTIIVDGNDFSNFTEKDFDNYRNIYLGFIFQDFHLIESLTIKENIKLALDLQGVRNTKKRIKEVLKLVDLEGYENRYPKELSGGQQQRVAIARAIIKNPKLILADEPTGNLDSKSAKNIMDVLKRLSQDTLVVVVSHNDEDAQFYADRIIELSDGRVIRDVERKNDEESKLISNNTINIPYHRKLTKEEQKIVNNALKTGKYKLHQQSDPFTKSKKINEQPVKVKLKSKKMSFSNVCRLSNKFAKGYYRSSFFTSILMSFLVILLAICQTFSSFNGSYLIDDAIAYNGDENYILTKGLLKDDLYPSLNKDYVVEIKDEEIEEFYKKGYEGNIYKLYNKFIPLAKNYQGESSRLRNKDYDFVSSIYTDQGEGILHCDEEFLINKYGVDGKVDVLAGSIDPNYKNDGSIILTDYAADCLINNHPSYQGLEKLEAYKKIAAASSVNSRCKVKAIINTNYAERYKKLFETVKYIKLIENSKIRNNEIEKMQKSDIYTKFVQEVNDYLTIGYYIGEMDCKEYIFQNAQYTHAAYIFNNVLYLDGDNNIVTDSIAFTYSKKVSLKEGEMVIPYYVYNLMYDTNYSYGSDISQFEEHDLIVNVYDPYSDDKSNPIISKEFKVVGINTFSTVKDSIYVSNEDYLLFADSFFFTRALYFDNAKSITSIFTPSVQEGIDLYVDNVYFDAIYKIMDLVIVFNELFLVIVIGLVLISIFIMTGYSRRSVKRKQLDIGILKCIGGENKHLFQIFLSQSLFITLSIILFSTLGMILLDGVINNLLVNSLILFLKTDLIKNMVMIEYNYIVFLIIDAVILIITFVTSSSILGYLEKMKPINIIRNKNRGLLEK